MFFYVKMGISNKNMKKGGQGSYDSLTPEKIDPDSKSLDALTAKVLLVIDHPNALFLLAMYNRTYSHFGLRLIIDETTVFRSPFIDSDSSGGSGTTEGSGNQSKSDVEKFDTLDTFGMEVA